MALAYPRFFAGEKDPEAGDLVPQQYERIPRSNGSVRATDGCLVHFDIDPQNGTMTSPQIHIIMGLIIRKVMIGDFDERHRLVPIIKVRTTLPQVCRPSHAKFTSDRRPRLWYANDYGSPSPIVCYLVSAVHLLC